MNIKKSFLVALATVTAVASVSAVAVSAAGLGESASDTTTVTVEAGKAATATVKTDDAAVTVSIPANALAAGEYTFKAAKVADSAFESAFDAAVKSDFKDVFEVAVSTADGLADLKDVTVTVANEKGYDVVYIKDGDTFKKVTATSDENGLTFTVPNGSKVVLAKAAKEEPNSVDPTSQPSTPSTPSTPGTPAQTGDNAAATATVFAVMGVVALGTALAATKMKKSAK